MKLYILQYESHLTHESVVIGVYGSIEKVIESANVWREEHNPRSHLFYDVKELDEKASWTNDQRAIYQPIRERS